MIFRQEGKVPELWNPENGNISPIPIYKETEEGISLPLSLAPHESAFVVFKPGIKPVHFTKIAHGGIHPPKVRYSDQGIEFWEEGEFGLGHGEDTLILNNFPNVKSLEGAWEIYFPEGWGAPDKAIFPELKSWTESENEGIKYFSGTARYEKNLSMKCMLLSILRQKSTWI